MAGRLSRFLHLEKARRDDGEGPAVPLARERFGAEPPPAAAAEVDFEAERKAQLESGIELDRPTGSDQPFLRCPRCEADNGRQAARCLNCQLPLQTQAVLQWNGRFWLARQAQVPAEPAQSQSTEVQELREQQRRLGEALAREIAQRESMRHGFRGLSGDGYDTTPFGVRLFRMIQKPTTRFAVALSFLGVFLTGVGMAIRGGPQSPVRFIGVGIAVLVLALFTPNRPRRRRFFTDDPWW